jgi:hypothetical protein
MTKARNLDYFFVCLSIPQIAPEVDFISFPLILLNKALAPEAIAVPGRARTTIRAIAVAPFCWS